VKNIRIRKLILVFHYIKIFCHSGWGIFDTVDNSFLSIHSLVAAKHDYADGGNAVHDIKKHILPVSSEHGTGISNQKVLLWIISVPDHKL